MKSDDNIPLIRDFLLGVTIITIVAFVMPILGGVKNARHSDAEVVSYEPLINHSDAVVVAPATTELPKQIGGADKIQYTGDSVLLASLGPNGTIADVTQFPVDTDIITTYIVRPGDNLTYIARMFNLSINTIKWVNGLKNNKIYPGQKLIIMPTDGIEVVIQKGDTISKLAKKYKADIDEIYEFNNIDKNTKLTIGDKIFIPGAEIEAGALPTSPKSKSRSSKYANYYADPLKGKWRLSQRFHGRWRGIDMAAPTGTPIYASAPGRAIVVNKSGWGGGYGLYVVLSHSNGSKTLYAHMSKVTAKLGEYYNKGDLIGYVGSTGRSTGPHLHFEIRNGIDVPYNEWRK